MPDIERIVAEMPKVEVPSGVGLCIRYRDEQCCLLAEAGYRNISTLPAYIEDATWEYKFGDNRGRGHISLSRQLLESIEIGEIKRIIHNDIHCRHKRKGGGYSCGILVARGILKKKGYCFRIYHEAEHVCIVARIEI